MAVFRIEKTRDYTVMSNHHLRNTDLSLKAKGLLSLMLSLPEDWDYTMKGLARICKDGIDSISGGMILSRLVDTFFSRILYPMLPLSGNHSIAVV